MKYCFHILLLTVNRGYFGHFFQFFSCNFNIFKNFADLRVMDSRHALGLQSHHLLPMSDHSLATFFLNVECPMLPQCEVTLDSNLFSTMVKAMPYMGLHWTSDCVFKKIPTTLQTTAQLLTAIIQQN